MHIKNILKDDWYKTATKEEMRIALMHVEQGAIDRLSNHLNNEAKELRNEVFEECSTDCNWKKG